MVKLFPEMLNNMILVENRKAEETGHLTIIHANGFSLYIHDFLSA